MSTGQLRRQTHYHPFGTHHLAKLFCRQEYVRMAGFLTNGSRSKFCLKTRL